MKKKGTPKGLKKYIRSHRQKKTWMTLVGYLACVVVFCTVYALVLPAVAMESDQTLNCSYTVHQHTADCYDEDGKLICGYADYVVHTHSEEYCYDEDGNLICELEEIAEHKHDASCYETTKVLICGETESEGHVHDDSCYAKVKGDLICTNTDEDHVHTDDCYEWTDTLICGLEEGEGAHHHTEDCYETQTVLTCGKAELHTHSASCYDGDGNLICGLLQLEEHNHDESCLEEAGEGTEEASAEDEENKILTCEGEDYTVTVSYGEDAELPEGVELIATEYEKDSETYLARYAEAAELYGWDEGEDYTENIRLFNIGLYVDGEEIEPAAPVKVSIAYAGQEESNDYTITHFGESETETVEATTTYENGTQTVDFDLDGFSDIMTMAGPGGNQDKDHNGDHSGNQGGGQNELNPSSYNSNAYVYWDTMNSNENGSYQGSQDSRIVSVELNSKSVVWGNSNSTSWSTNGVSRLSAYFPNAKKSNSSSDTSTMESGTLTITPAAGYYVTKVVVACTGVGSEKPYNCNTWEAGNAFTAEFSVGTSGAATVDISSLDFSHSSNSNNYFILIKLAPIPSPLYVEYDYGDIVEIDDVNQDIFADFDGWVSGNSGNEYGTGGVQTANTQYEYAYAGTADASAAANWKHYANSVTDEAKAAAAKVGYYFAGWKAEYYTSCTTSTAKSEYGNYTYTFTKSYGTSNYGENDLVSLTTNVRLIAQWKPYSVTVTKVVQGDEGVDISSLLGSAGKTYTINMTDGDKNYSAALNVTSTSTSYTESITVSPVVPGTYKVQEAEAGASITTTEGQTYYCATAYDAETVTITENDIKSNTAKNVTVTNTYTERQPTVDISIKKVDSVDSNKALSGAKFLLYKEEKDINSYYTHTDEGGTQWVESRNNAGVLTSGTDGTFPINGIEDGTYYLEENKAPDGYNLLTERVTINVVGGEVISAICGASPMTISDDGLTVTVTNSAGYTLPNTGGTGTILFIYSGLLLMAGAVGYGYKLRRRRERRGNI